jgi:hypothetical protein
MLRVHRAARKLPDLFVFRQQVRQCKSQKKETPKDKDEEPELVMYQPEFGKEWADVQDIISAHFKKEPPEFVEEVSEEQRLKEEEEIANIPIPDDIFTNQDFLIKEKYIPGVHGPPVASQHPDYLADGTVIYNGPLTTPARVVS